MSSMAFSMYLFTRDEGTLRTTQDLFTQAYYFVEEGMRLSATIHEFANQVCLYDAILKNDEIIMSNFILDTKSKCTKRHFNTIRKNSTNVLSIKIKIKNSSIRKKFNIYKSIKLAKLNI